MTESFCHFSKGKDGQVSLGDAHTLTLTHRHTHTRAGGGLSNSNLAAQLV